MKLSKLWLVCSMFFLFIGVVMSVAHSHHRNHQCTTSSIDYGCGGFDLSDDYQNEYPIEYNNNENPENPHIEHPTFVFPAFESAKPKDLWAESYNAFQSGNPVKAVRSANRLVKKEGSADAYLLQAYMNRAVDRPEEAFEALEKCFDRAKGHAKNNKRTQQILIDAWTSKAAIYLDLNQYKAAENANRKAYGQAILHRSQIDSDSDKRVNYYQFACVHAMFAAINEAKGEHFNARVDKKLAISALRKAVKLGYDNGQHISTDLDLKALHGDSRFNKILKELVPKVP